MISNTCYNVPMRYGLKYKLNIQDYTKNAAKKFSYVKLIIFTIISLALTILLLISALQSNYQGIAFIFTGLVFILIFGYTILNISALIKKIKNSKK